MVPASASISARTPMGMVRLWDTWPIIAPAKVGFPIKDRNPTDRRPTP